MRGKKRDIAVPSLKGLRKEERKQTPDPVKKRAALCS